MDGSTWLSSLVWLQLAVGGMAAEPVEVRAHRVEGGLRPAIVLNELTTERFSLIDRMRFYKVPGASVAVIDKGTIAWARGYGVREAGTENTVAIDTKFQAASISKLVAAVVVLRLVEQGSLDLDEDVNRKLRSWKLPENEFTKDKKVSLRWLLSHRAGLTDYAGFRGAGPSEPRPTLREILESGNWTPAPIRAGIVPGTRFAYSGGGYCLIEQLLEDVAGKPFPTLARELVFTPLKMENSTFDQDMPPTRKERVAVGHQRNGKKLPRNWYVYPATSAAGLWTTPSELARFATELQQAKVGKPSPVLSLAMASEMLSIQGVENDRDSKIISVKEGIAEEPPPAWGLGVGLIGRPPTRFFHSGSNPGYQCELQAYVQGGQGAVIMTNADQGWRLGREILWSIASEYNWQDYAYRPEVKKSARLSQDELQRFVGRYRISFSQASAWTLRITRDGDRLSAWSMNYARPVQLYPASHEECFAIEDAMTLRFLKDEAGTLSDIVSDLGWRATRQ